MIIARGAEAVLRKEDGTLTKERIKKGYRIEKIDISLRRGRTRREAGLIREARRSGAPAPRIIEEKDFSIKMEFIDGKRAKDILSGKNFREICAKIAEAAAKMHSNGIIHGDLTTSNMIFHDGDIYFIDFGLGFRSRRTEDKASDLFLLHEALESTHFSLLEKAWNTILKVYGKNYSGAQDVFAALRKIEKRRRYTKKEN
ncbi:MAG: Kae1-associated serine/threonine protein kinase [Candidatus Aenigmarchaeota archaeon]|nr:Kae1-associated serine/threonine protein kinase [Candidatus Aenigmarchaeota archaeon]